MRFLLMLARSTPFLSNITLASSNSRASHYSANQQVRYHRPKVDRVLPTTCQPQRRLIAGMLHREVSRLRNSEQIGHIGTYHQRYRKIAGVRVGCVGKDRVGLEIASLPGTVLHSLELTEELVTGLRLASRLLFRSRTLFLSPAQLSESVALLGIPSVVCASELLLLVLQPIALRRSVSWLRRWSAFHWSSRRTSYSRARPSSASRRPRISTSEILLDPGRRHVSC